MLPISPSFRAVWRSLAFGLCLAGLGQGEEDDKGPPPFPSKPMLWKMEGNGLQKPVYFCASVPIPIDPKTPLHPQVAKALKESGMLFTEGLLGPEGEKFSIEAALRKDGGTLQASLGPELSKRLGAEMAAAVPGWRVEMSNNYQTWLVAYSVPMARLGGGTTFDRLLWQKAADADKITAGLTPRSEYYKPYVDLTEAEQVQLVKQMLDSADRQRDKATNDLRLLTAAFATGDVAAYLKAYSALKKEDEKYNDQKISAKIERGLPEHCRILVAELLAHLKEEPAKGAFVLLSVDCLVQPGTVRPRLEKEGYTLVRVRDEGSE